MSETLNLFEQIAGCLGAVLVKSRADCGGTFADVKLPDGVRFHMRAGGYGNEGRITFSGDWPTYRKADVNSTPQAVIPRDIWENNARLESPSISVSDKRTAAQIVKDVERRFLPTYRPVWLKCKARADETTESYRSQREVVERTAAATGGTVPKHNTEFNEISYGYEIGEAKHRGGCGDSPHAFEVTLRDVSPEELTALVALIRKARGQT